MLCGPLLFWHSIHKATITREHQQSSNKHILIQNYFFYCKNLSTVSVQAEVCKSDRYSTPPLLNAVRTYTFARSLGHWSRAANLLHKRCIQVQTSQFGNDKETGILMFVLTELNIVLYVDSRNGPNADLLKTVAGRMRVAEMSWTTELL